MRRIANFNRYGIKAPAEEVLKEHISQVKLVLRKLIKFGLYAKLNKCKFHVDNVDFLGFHVSAKGIEMLRDRIATIMDWPLSESHKDVQAFVGFANFYRHFIEINLSGPTK